MEAEFLQMIIVNLPNFAFAALALAGAYRLIQRQFAMIEELTRRCDCKEHDDDP